jgi:hypothetical protein
LLFAGSTRLSAKFGRLRTKKKKSTAEVEALLPPQTARRKRKSSEKISEDEKDVKKKKKRRRPYLCRTLLERDLDDPVPRSFFCRLRAATLASLNRRVPHSLQR